MNLVLRLQAEVAAALKEMRAVQKEVKGIADAGKQAGADLKPMDAALAAVGEKGAAAARKAAVGMDELQRELDVVRQSAVGAAGGIDAITPAIVQSGQASGAAAGQVGNLAAQWNDVVMMIAAGQNPMQLAIQQGSQITQIFGNGGASGAMALLRGSVTQLLNPFNLATIGIIGFGAAAIQWLMSAGQAAVPLEESIADLEAAVSTYEKTAALASETQEVLNEKFGDGANEARAYYTELADLQRRAAERKTTELAGSMRQELAPDTLLKSSQRNVADFFDVSIWSREATKAINPVLAAFDALEKAQGIENQVSALRNLKTAFETAAMASGGYSAQEEIALANITKALIEQERLLALIESQKRQAAENNGRFEGQDAGIAAAMASEEERRAAIEASNEALEQGYQLYAATRAESDATVASAAKNLAVLQAEAELQALINQYGADSAVVTAARAEAEREVYAAMVDGLDVSAAMKDELMAAWDAANGIAGARIAGMLEAALGPASSLVAKLWEGAKAAAAMQQAKAWVAANQPGGTSDLARQYQQYGEGRMAAERAAQTTVQFSGAVPVVAGRTASGSRAGAGGGGGGAGRPERDSFDDLQRRAKEAMSALDDALAAIQEKVQLGLLTTAEAADAIGTAKERAANQMAELIPKLTKVQEAAGPKGAEAIKLWRDQIKGLVADMGDASDEIKDLSEDLAGGFESRFTKAMMGSKNAFADFGNFVLETMAELASKRFTENIISPLFDSILGGLFGGVGGGGGGTGSLGLPMPFADGGVPDAPLSVYSNQVLDRPTLFPMAGGKTGLMAEAGTEAIMPVGDGGVLAQIGGAETRLPLIRGAGGRLGVRVPDWQSPADVAPARFALGGVPGSAGMIQSGGGISGGVTVREGDLIVNVENRVAGAQVKTEHDRENGTRMLRVIIDQVDAGLAEKQRRGDSVFGNALAANLGASRTGR